MTLAVPAFTNAARTILYSISGYTPLVTIRLLRLTHSDDFVEQIPPELRAGAIADRILADASGEEVDSVSKGIWPVPELPDHIARWMGRYEPDMVIIRIAAYWFTYESVPLKLERMLGPWSRRLTSLGNRAAANRVIGHNAAFKLLQKASLRIIGGATLLTPDETVGVAEACLRPILSREGVGVVLRGPRTPFGGFKSRRALRRSEIKRQCVNRRLAELCSRHHLTFAGFDSMEELLDPSIRLGDRLHSNLAGQEQVGRMEGGALVREWRRVQAISDAHLESPRS